MIVVIYPYHAQDEGSVSYLCHIRSLHGLQYCNPWYTFGLPMRDWGQYVVVVPVREGEGRTGKEGLAWWLLLCGSQISVFSHAASGKGHLIVWDWISLMIHNCILILQTRLEFIEALS